MKLSAEGQLRLAVKLAFLVGVNTAATTVFAQTAAGTPGGTTELQAVQVTGSRIKQANLTQSSAVTTLNDKEFQLSGTTDVETLLNSLPQTFAEFSSNDSNGATGTATVNLRGLGSQETLVLIDGKRLMGGDPLQSSPSADLNFIPAALIDRVDVLTGGASAVYGSDAVAGVVNFIMKKDFEGFRVDSEVNRTDHSDGTTYDTTLIWGSNFGGAGGNGNVTLYAGFTRMQAVTQAERGYSECALGLAKSFKNGPYTHHVCSGSYSIPETLTISYDTGAYLQNNPNQSGDLEPWDGHKFNFAPYNYLQRPDTRWNIGGFAHDRVNEHFDIYGSAMFMDNHTVAAVAPTGLFGTQLNTPCISTDTATNALMTPEEFQTLCPNAGQTTAHLLLLSRLTALGPRESDLRHDQFRITTGVRGEIIQGLDYDVSAQHGEVIFADAELNYLNTQHAENALDVEIAPSTAGLPPGQQKILCRSAIEGYDPSCKPYQIFQPDKITQSQLNYLRGNGYSQATQIENVVSSSLSADLGQYNVRSPLAKNGLGLAGGVEYRYESLDYKPDELTEHGQLGGAGGPSPPVNGSFQVPELFGEGELPIIEGMRFAKLLSIDTAYRWGNYSEANDAHSWKLGLKYQPIDDVLLRGSFQRATRAPSVNELFGPSTYGLIAGSDPCAGTNPTATKGQCELTGVAASDYGNGNVKDCNSSQCNIQTGGTISLKPELSITRSLGIVITPTFVKHLSFTVDYFDISVDNAIGILPMNAIFDDCYATKDENSAACQKIVRAPSGRLSGQNADGTDPGYMVDFNQNTGFLRTKGIDFQGDYRIRLNQLHLGNHGQFIWSYFATWNSKFLAQTQAGQPVSNCAGLYGPDCGIPDPHYRQKVRMTWQMPNGVDLSAAWRYYGGVHLDYDTADTTIGGGGQNTYNIPDQHIGSKSYLDLSGTYTLPVKATNVTLRAGISNVLGQNPPTVDSVSEGISSPPFGNANTYPNVYDPLGRVLFVGVTADF